MRSLSVSIDQGFGESSESQPVFRSSDDARIEVDLTITPVFRRAPNHLGGYSPRLPAESAYNLFRFKGLRLNGVVVKDSSGSSGPHDQRRSTIANQGATALATALPTDY
jgi:hypothetical protein